MIITDVDSYREMELDRYLNSLDYEEIEEVKKCECGEEATHLASFYEKVDTENVFKNENICHQCINDLTEEFEIYKLEEI